MFRATLLRAAEASLGAIKTPISNPYKAQKQWPPDFAKINPKHQFRLERRYRRRAKLKYARPQWMKYTKLLQWGGCSLIAVYSVLFMDWGDMRTPFPKLREWLRRQANSFWSTNTSLPPPSSPNSSVNGLSGNISDGPR